MSQKIISKSEGFVCALAAVLGAVTAPIVLPKFVEDKNAPLKARLLQVENERKMRENDVNSIEKAIYKYGKELDSLEKTIKAKNNALKKNMPTPQNAQAVVKGHSVKPNPLIIKQKENVRV